MKYADIFAVKEKTTPLAKITISLGAYLSLLAEHFLKQYCIEIGKEIRGVTLAAPSSG